MTTSYLSQFNEIGSLHNALTEKTLSARELTQEALKSIQQSNLNAFSQVDADLSLQQADTADHLLASTSSSQLTGIPIAYKDLLVTQGWRTTAASKMLQHYVSPFDATAISQLESCGTISLGKLNCNEFGLPATTPNSIFGPVRNPWGTNSNNSTLGDGAATAVAAGLVMAAIATDTGGELRQAASAAGVTGIRPTYGVVSRYGMLAVGSSFDTIGPIARHASDLVPLLDTISGFDPADGTSLEQCAETPNRAGRIQADFEHHKQQLNNQTAGNPLKGLRIGISDDTVVHQQAIQELEDLGAEIVSVKLSHLALSTPTYDVLSAAEASTNLSRYDGVHFGYRSPSYKGLEDMVARSRTEGFGEAVKLRILLGTHILSEAQYDQYYLQAQRIRRLIATELQQALNNHCDILLAPAVTDPENESPAQISNHWFTATALAGLPVISIPCGFNTERRQPLGLQLIGNYFQEGKLLAIANCYQQTTQWHQLTPETA